MNPLTWQNPEQLFVAQVLKKIFYNSVAELRNNYIDTTLERTINAYDVAVGLVKSINKEDDSWNWFIE